MTHFCFNVQLKHQFILIKKMRDRDYLKRSVLTSKLKQLSNYFLRFEF